MNNEQLINHLNTTFKSLRSLSFIQKHLPTVENLLQHFLRLNQPQNGNQIEYRCQSTKCPFRISFIKIKTSYKLRSYTLKHNHSENQTPSFELKCLIKKIEQKTDYVFNEYFISRINKKTNELKFIRPGLIIQDLKKNHNFDLDSITQDKQYRVQLKKKFDNIIQFQRRNFQKMYPHIHCIEDEFQKLRQEQSLKLKIKQEELGKEEGEEEEESHNTNSTQSTHIRTEELEEEEQESISYRDTPCSSQILAKQKGQFYQQNSLNMHSSCDSTKMDSHNDYSSFEESMTQETLSNCDQSQNFQEFKKEDEEEKVKYPSNYSNSIEDQNDNLIEQEMAINNQIDNTKNQQNHQMQRMCFSTLYNNDENSIISNSQKSEINNLNNNTNEKINLQIVRNTANGDNTNFSGKLVSEIIVYNNRIMKETQFNNSNIPQKYFESNKQNDMIYENNGQSLKTIQNIKKEQQKIHENIPFGYISWFQQNHQF